GEDLMDKLTANKEDVSDEIADVAIYLIELCYVLDINLFEAIEAKLKKNAEKYPIAKSKGNAKKYTEL
ncbi:nucleotide pyrophosphohydrolase, partial [candidate division WWE3 bacterium]|nr:nucleotide pyrophosphohydrolase [candidate division WWE3 bacterium]